MDKCRSICLYMRKKCVLDWEITSLSSYLIPKMDTGELYKKLVQPFFFFFMTSFSPIFQDVATTNQNLVSNFFRDLNWHCTDQLISYAFFGNLRHNFLILLFLLCLGHLLFCVCLVQLTYSFEGPARFYCHFRQSCH